MFYEMASFLIFLSLLHFHFYIQAIASPLPSAFLCSPDQSHALLLFKNAFSLTPVVSSYPKTESWTEGTDCCLWDGVTCDFKTGYVIGLNLSYSMLYGSIHSDISLFSLSHLQMLDLSYNDFNGSHIPSRFGYFSNLTYLNLNSSNFDGRVPSEISLLSNLVSLDLSGNDLTVDNSAFIKNFQNLSNLRELELSGLNLSSVEPSSFLNLPSSLLYLSLRDCGLKGKFLNIFRLSNLNSIYLSSNYELSIDGIAFNRLVQNLTNLREVDLEGVNMSLVAPIHLQNFSSYLSFLSLGNCGLRGEFPGSFVQRPYLQALDLSSNEGLIGFLPTSSWSTSLSSLDLSYTSLVVSSLEFFGNLTLLSYLRLSYCNISGEIPSSFQNLKHLSYLDLSFNNLSGHIPNFFANFTLLLDLFLSDNQLTGPIPSLSLPNLTILVLSNNMPNGIIPSSLFTLSNLAYLNLKNNQLHGIIPSFQNNAFRFIDLSNNLLHGPIPTSIFDKMYISGLILSSNNKLTGEVSSSFCKLQYLDILDLSNNSFVGSIPPCLSNNSISVLHLGINNFEGTIPDTFSKDCKLRYLNFKGNQLEGQVPPSMINCTDLELIDLSDNKINDTFPHFLGILPQLQGLVIRSNKFHGLVKRSNLSYPFLKLRIFDLSNNSFKGPLPAEYFDHFEAMMNSDHRVSYMRSFESFSYYDYSLSLTFKGLEIELVKIQNTLTTIDLSSNSFRGKIPKSIGKLKSLISLNLSHNNLTNDVPPSLANLTNLESLDLSSNLLSGRIPSNLVDLIFLQVFNVAHNRLEGPIPQGKQFNTFDNDSYERNLGLCGFPLKDCNDGETQHPTPSKQDELELENGFGWKAVLMGYSYGVGFGLVMGYLVFRRRKPAWFVRMVEEEVNRMPKRFKKKFKSHGRKTNQLKCQCEVQMTE